MRGGVVVFLPALLVAGAIATVAGACTSFDDVPEPSEASVADGSSIPDGASDGGADTGRCTSVGSDFATGKVVPGFVPVRTDGGTIEWQQGEGAITPGSLEATTPQGGGQAQIERDFPIGATTRARLAFSARLKSVANGGRTSIGCTLQLSTEPDGGGDYGWIEIIFKHENGQILFDQDSHNGGSSIDSTPYASASAEWTPFELELRNITKTTAQYRARVGTTEIELSEAVLPSAPHHFHIKCGIDTSMVAADILTDELTFEMCE